jgi:hypothetical protein
MGDQKRCKITTFSSKKQEKHHKMQKKCKNIWSCQKKAVPLHSLSSETRVFRSGNHSIVARREVP